jgi:predicted aconitase with swiveling domain
MKMITENTVLRADKIVADAAEEAWKFAGDLIVPYGKGSPAAPLVLLELAKQGTAPAAIINIETDPLLVAGPIISKHFYSRTIPVITLSGERFSLLKTGMHAVIDGSKGEIVLSGFGKKESTLLRSKK